MRDPGNGAPSPLQRLIACAAVYLLFFGGYGAVNRLLPLARCRDLTTSLDRAIPLWPAMVFPFYLAYGLILAPAWLTRERRRLRRMTLAFATLVALSCALFVLFPVQVPRPASLPTGLAAQLIRAIYQADRPVCGFPSLHVSASLLAALVVLSERRGAGLALLGLALLTAASTLLIKQHVAWDVVGGAALALAVHLLFFGRRPHAGAEFNRRASAK